jgi:opacity protein-like surface antigen
MKKVILTSLAALMVATSANAGMYVSSHLSTVADRGIAVFDSIGVIGSLGYAFDNGLRLETDIYTGNLISMTNTSNQFGIGVDPNGRFGFSQLKALYDFKIGGKFTPYVGFGLSKFAYDSFKTYDSFDLGGSFIGGVSFALNSKLSLDMQYNRVFSYVYSFNKNNTNSSSSGSSLWKLGLAYKF